MIKIGSRLISKSNNRVFVVVKYSVLSEIVQVLPEDSTTRDNVLTFSVRDLRLNYAHLDDKTGAHCMITIPSENDVADNPLDISSIHRATNIHTTRRYLTKPRDGGANYMTFSMDRNGSEPMYKFVDSRDGHDTGLVFDVYAKWKGSMDSWIKIASVIRHVIGDRKGGYSVLYRDRDRLWDSVTSATRKDTRWELSDVGDNVFDRHLEDVQRLQADFKWIYGMLYESEQLHDRVYMQIWCRESK